MERSQISHRMLVFDPLCSSFGYFALHSTIPKETESNQVQMILDFSPKLVEVYSLRSPHNLDLLKSAIGINFDTT